MPPPYSITLLLFML